MTRKSPRKYPAGCPGIAASTYGHLGANAASAVLYTRRPAAPPVARMSAFATNGNHETMLASLRYATRELGR